MTKLESTGSHMVALNSKTYILSNAEDKVIKLSAKGVNKDRIESPKKAFEGVLETGKSHHSLNLGFMMYENHMCTYEGDKAALTNAYIKRYLEPDGISTSPISRLMYTPHFRGWNLIYDNHELSNFYKMETHYEGNSYACAEQLFLYKKAKYHQQEEIAADILGGKNLKYISQSVHTSPEWKDVEESVMKDILQNKVRNHKVRTALLEVIDFDKTVYCNKNDQIFSCGYDYRLAELLKKSEFSGNNTLISLWKQIRENEIRNF